MYALFSEFDLQGNIVKPSVKIHLTKTRPF